MPQPEEQKPERAAQHDDERKQARRRWLLLLFGCSFLIRLVYLLEIRSSPFFDQPIIDADWHDRWAQEIINANFWGKGVYFRAPLYAYFAAAVYAVFGHSYFWLRLVQHTVGACLPALVFLVGERLLARRTAIVAAIVTAVYPTLIFFEGEILPPVVILFVNMLLLLELLKLESSTHWKRWLLCGVMLGVSALLRPDVLLFAPFLLGWVWLRFRESGRRFVLRRCGLLLGGLMLVVAPVTVRNMAIGRDFVLIASQGGVNLYAGNNPQATGFGPAIPEFRIARWQDFVRESKRVAEEQTGRQLKPSEISRFWTRRALKFILGSPGQSLTLFVRKLYYFWNGFELSNNQDIYSFRRDSVVLSLLLWRIGNFSFPYGLVVPLGLVGLAVAYRRGQGLPALYVLSYMIAVVLFFVTSRYRMAIVPLMILFAVHGAARIHEYAKKRRYGETAAVLACVVGLGFIANSDFYGTYADRYMSARAFYNRGSSYMRKRQFDKAREEFKEALRIDDSAFVAHFGLGRICLEEGDFKGGEECLRKAISVNPDFLEAREELAMVCVAGNRMDDAVAQVKEMLRRNPRYVPRRALEVGNICQIAGEFRKALSFYSMALTRNPRSAAVLSNIGLTHHKMGNREEALKWLKAAVEMAPRYPIAHGNLGLVHEAMGQKEAARACYNRALQIEPSYAPAKAGLRRLEAESENR